MISNRQEQVQLEPNLDFVMVLIYSSCNCMLSFAVAEISLPTLNDGPTFTLKMIDTQLPLCIIIKDTLINK